MKKRNKSILQTDLSYCYICGRPREAIHEIFYGTGNRKISIEHGFYVGLCTEHHNGGNTAVHFNRAVDLELKRKCQAVYEKTHTREQFIRLIGKSYLE